MATTGGPNPGTLCDTVTRWETSDTGTAVQPRWIDDTGGDTLLSIVSSGARRLHRRTPAVDEQPRRTRPPGGGAVPRPGLAGVDPDVGLPLSWNPGRNPRGVGAEAVYVTDAGLWVGSDTDWIGNYPVSASTDCVLPARRRNRACAGDHG